MQDFIYINYRKYEVIYGDKNRFGFVWNEGERGIDYREV